MPAAKRLVKARADSTVKPPAPPPRKATRCPSTPTAGYQMVYCSDGVLQVDDAPLAAQAFAVGSAIA